VVALVIATPWLPVYVPAAGLNVGAATCGSNNVTVAAADFVASAWLVAVIVTVCCAVTLAGAV
jgi:hypothetical protein